MHVCDLLKIAVDSGASDLHLKVGSYPMLRVRGVLVPTMSDRRLTHEDMVSISAAVLSTSQRDKFKERRELDLAYSVAELGRFRCNVFHQRDTVGMTFRVIPTDALSIEKLLLPPVLNKIAAEERGRESSFRSNPFEVFGCWLGNPALHLGHSRLFHADFLREINLR